VLAVIPEKSSMKDAGPIVDGLKFSKLALEFG
jgi:hypothetical protein